MHSLEVIVAKNDRAAGREAALAENDLNLKLRNKIIDAEPVTDAFAAGFIAGRMEG